MEPNSKQKFENTPYTDLNLYIDHPVTDALFDHLLKALNSQFPKRTRTKTKDQTEIAVIAILSNLLRANWSSINSTAISLARETYVQNEVAQPIGFKAIRRAIDFLTSPQVLDGQTIDPILIVHKGFMAPDGYRENSKLELDSKPLIDQITISLKENDQYKDIDIDRFVDKGNIVYNTRDYEFTESEGNKFITPITSTLNPKFLTRCDKSPIRLTDENGRRLEVFHNSEINRMTSEIDAYNEFLASHQIGLFLSDDELLELLSATRHKLIERRVGKDFVYTNAQVLGWQKNRLHRVFNRSSFDCGGRHYGGFWQNILKRYRPFITINGHPTVELDYSSLHPTMIYHQRGLKPLGDPYSIDGLTHEYRGSVKTAFLVLINAAPSARHLESLDDLHLPKDWSVPRLTRAIEEKHCAVADAFRSDSGVRLQRLDSDIAGYVMREMRLRHHALVLPVHDSFIVAEDMEPILHSVMEEAYRHVMGDHKIGIDRKPTIFERLGDPNEESKSAQLLRSVESMIDAFDGQIDSQAIIERISLASEYRTYLERFPQLEISKCRQRTFELL